MVAKPTSYLNWTDGAAGKVVQPPPAQLLSGWTEGEVPPMEYMNWLFWEADQWIQYLDQNQNLGQPSSASQQNARLINGGTWSFAATAGTLAWSAAFNIAYPSIPDVDNQIPTGSVTLADGQVAYVNTNVPFSTTGTTTSGSTSVTQLAYQQGIVVGQTVTGAGIPTNTTVSSIAGSTVNLSQAATASASGVVLTFAMTSAPAVQVANSQTLIPASSSVIIARRVGAQIFLGVNTGQMLLRDGEARPLLAAGYQYAPLLPAGVNIAAGQCVYMSQGAADGGRTQGSVYLVDITNPMRTNCIGIAVQTIAAGNSVLVVSEGRANGFTGLTPGATYYAGSTLGSLTTLPPASPGQYVIPVGQAASATAIRVNPAAGMQASLPTYSVDTYGVTTEVQLQAAVAACAAAGGGVIALMAPITVNTAFTLPTQTRLEGSKYATLLTLNASITMGSDSVMSDVTMTGAVNLVLCPNLASKFSFCKFILATTSAVSCITVSGVSNRINDCVFSGVLGGSSGYGITYAGGSDNRDNDCIYS